MPEVVKFNIMIGKLRSILLKDVSGENESSRVCFIMRLNSLLMCVYFLIWVIGFFVLKNYGPTITCALCLTANVVVCFLTYRDKIFWARVIYSSILVMWMSRFVMSWGWDCGIQYFLFVLLVQVFIGSYSTQAVKFAQCIILFILGLGLYIWQLTFEPIEILSAHVSYHFSLINIVFVFMTMIVILHFFTHDRMETEAKLARYNVKLMNDAYHDPLTKLRNRESVRNYIKEKINSDTAAGGLCIAMGDIDFFKKINDTYGHAAGDEVLVTLADFFNEYMKDHGIVARWGGEEFLFVFVNENLDDAGREVFDILSKVREMPIPWKDEVLNLTMTFGVSDVAMTSDDKLMENINAAITSADEKLYMGKQNGRNTVII